jgi:choline/carnitine/betaine transport
MTGFLVFAIWLYFSRFGDIRLGPEGEEPEFHTVTWFAMLFSAGMGIGMLFFGVAEPMFHTIAPPQGAGSTPEAAKLSMAVTLFHWCLHPWALYAMVALCLAYFGFRRGMPLSFRSVFFPLFGKKVYGVLGDIIDVMALLATLFGLATSLGLGAKQVNAGLNHVFGLPQGMWIQIVLIACITAMAVASLVSGLHVGIRRLSEANMGLAGFLLLFLFIFGPTVYLLDSLVNNVGGYLEQLPQRSFWTASYAEGSAANGGEASSGWLGSWTVFYWGWWIAWSPFVGTFIARVSRGRTIREFIAGVLLVPSAVALVWMTGFGNTAIHQEIVEKRAQNYQVMEKDEATGLAVSTEGQLVAQSAPAVASPRGIRVRRDDEGAWVTAERSVPVTYDHGVLVNKRSGAPYEPTEAELFSGKYRSVKKRLTLGGYLSSPVLNEARTAEFDTTATAMFVMLDAYPVTWLTALLGTLCVILFFVTSSDSASLVADMIASGGSKNPTTGTRLFWGILEGTLAAVLLAAGGLVALKTGSITLGLPFCVVIILMCVSLHRGLSRDLSGDLPEEHLEHMQANGDGESEKREPEQGGPEEDEEGSGDVS